LLILNPMLPNDIPTQLPIAKIIDENPNVKTFYFDYPLKSKPGQFIMLWLPGIDQKPFSVSSDDDITFGLTIFKRGPTTEKLFGMRVGDRVGISGPYGSHFSIKPNTHYIMVAGGYGAAPLSFLAGEIGKAGSTADFCLGGRSKDFLLFLGRLARMRHVKLHITTDDGSCGDKCLVTDLIPNLIKSGSIPPLVVTCGPELMEKKVLDICNELNVECELSIERYVKCGIDICGQCTVDPLGICMCQEGPVVSREVANKIEGFGKYHRDKSEQKVYF